MTFAGFSKCRTVYILTNIEQNVETYFTLSRNLYKTKINKKRNKYSYYYSFAAYCIAAAACDATRAPRFSWVKLITISLFLPSFLPCFLIYLPTYSGPKSRPRHGPRHRFAAPGTAHRPRRRPVRPPNLAFLTPS